LGTGQCQPFSGRETAAGWRPDTLRAARAKAAWHRRRPAAPQPAFRLVAIPPAVADSEQAIQHVRQRMRPAVCRSRSFATAAGCCDRDLRKPSAHILMCCLLGIRQEEPPAEQPETRAEGNRVCCSANALSQFAARASRNSIRLTASSKEVAAVAEVDRQSSACPDRSHGWLFYRPANWRRPTPSSRELGLPPVADGPGCRPTPGGRGRHGLPPLTIFFHRRPPAGTGQRPAGLRRR